MLASFVLSSLIVLFLSSHSYKGHGQKAHHDCHACCWSFSVLLHVFVCRLFVHRMHPLGPLVSTKPAKCGACGNWPLAIYQAVPALPESKWTQDLTFLFRRRSVVNPPPPPPPPPLVHRSASVPGCARGRFRAPALNDMVHGHRHQYVECMCVELRAALLCLCPAINFNVKILQ